MSGAGCQPGRLAVRSGLPLWTSWLPHLSIVPPRTVLSPVDSVRSRPVDGERAVSDGTLPRSRGPREACFVGWGVGGVLGEAGGGGFWRSAVPDGAASNLTA